MEGFLICNLTIGQVTSHGAAHPNPNLAQSAMAFESQASRLRTLARNRNVLFGWSDHAEDERNKDGIAKIDVENMLKRCTVTNVEDTDGEEGWRGEGTDIDGRRIAAIVVAYEDDTYPEIKIVTVWAS